MYYFESMLFKNNLDFENIIVFLTFKKHMWVQNYINKE